MKKCMLLSISLASFLFLGSSCSNDGDFLIDIPDTKTVETTTNDVINVCTFDFVSADFLSTSDVSTRAVLLTDTKWKAGDVIRIKFLNGDAFLQNKVKQFANEWLTYANLQFKYVSSYEVADVKIGFNFNGDPGSWSVPGRECQKIAQNQPSMNFGWFTSSTPDSNFKRTIIHEFRHTLGLHHEHVNPTGNIQWNKPVVYAYYARMGWGKAQVDANLFAKVTTTISNYSAYDPQSIMHYPIVAAHTLNGYSVGENGELSATDKQFIGEQYPF